LREIDLDEGIAAALDALYADRLAMLCGAGLSMASPSNLPSAAELASKAKRKYDSLYGSTRPPLPPSIAEQAEFFFQHSELGTMYLRTLIDAHAFAGPPNAGHTAVADLLLVRAIQTAVSTNVDTLIEAAGMLLRGQVGVGIERRTVAALAPDISPYSRSTGAGHLTETTQCGLLGSSPSTQ
jgi:NAD-dependent SIR2 family protein deacetylase